MKKYLTFVALLATAACNDAPTSPLNQATTPALPGSVKASPELIANRYIVRFRDDEPNVTGRARALERSYGAITTQVYTSVMKGASMAMADDAAEALRADESVLAVEQDQVVHITATQAGPGWGLDRIDQRSLPYSGSYTYTSTGAGVTVYILDTGIDFTHVEFGGRAVKGIDELTSGGTAADCNGHGTHVAGIVGGATYGVAKGAKLSSVRVLNCSGTGTTSTVIAGIDWVAQNAIKPAVANMSISTGQSALMNQSIQNAINAGVTFVVAAGDNAADACTTSPASAAAAITVAASDSTDAFASFSNYGSCVDVIAPGVNIKSAWTGGAAINGNGSSTGISFTSGTNTASRIQSGTSMASPYVAGAAALYLQANPTWTPAQVSAAVVANATSNVITSVPAATANLLLYTGTSTGPVNQPPTATFGSPANNASFVQGASVAFAGTGSDPEDGTLTGASLVWTSSINGQIGTGTSFSTSTLSVGSHTITIKATDSQGATGTASRTIVITAANHPPTAAISSPAANASFVQGSTVTFTGTGSDTEDGALTGASLTWTSSINGPIGTGASFTLSTLSVGTHTITLQSKDSQGATGTATVSITITAPPNQPPVAVISAPTNNTSVVQGTSVTFTGSGTDPEDGALTGASLVWTSSINGQIGTGATFSSTTLSAGTHTITLTATDSKGATGTVTRTLIVTAPNQPPTASITTPANISTSAVQGSSISFAGTGADPEDGALSGASLVWTSSINGQIGTGTSFSTSTLSVGTHTITLTATDSKGATGTATRTVTITANQPPVSAISSPANNTSVVSGTTLTFTGTGSDPEDGTLSGASLTWTSSIDGAIGSGNTFTKGNLSIGTHTITLTSTDSKGLTGSATVTVVITANQPPVSSISAPANNTSVVQGTQLTFTGSGTDPEDGVLSGASLSWTSSIDGVIGSGTSFSKSNLSIGTHTITLKSTDSKGLTGSATVTVVITANQAPTATITTPNNNSTTVVQGTSVSFAGTASDPEDGALSGASLVWRSSINGQIGTGTSFSTSALSVGTHTITLTATDSKGATGTATRTVTVTSPPVNQPPVARYTSTCTGLATNQCSFDATTSTDDVGIVSWTWNWGNGKPAETKSVPTARNTWSAPGVYTVTLTVTDGGGLTSSQVQQITVGTIPNQPPTASITTPANNSTSVVQGTSVSFAGTGADPEDGALSGASLVWTSSINGQIGAGNSFSTSTLSVGTHTITLTATDSKGATGTATRTVTITPNQPPVASITGPANNTSVVQGTSLAFAGTGSDPEDGALSGGSLVWTSSINGQIGAGNSFSTSTLSVGTHTITLTATDSKGATGTASITVVITPNQPPVSSISAPANSTSVVTGTPLTFTGSSNDPEDGALSGASLTWTSSIDGVIGSGASFSKSNLSIGTHTITLTGTDSKGLTGSAAITVVITPNQPPTASIGTPANNSTSVVQGTSVSFAGTGSDPEDGALSGASLVWTSSINGQIGTGTSFSTSGLSVGQHTITLTATDSKGATGTATRIVTITANQPPVASISAPANNASFVQGASVAFAGTGSDPEDGTLTGASLVWTSSINGQIGSGTSFSTTTLSVGTHTITLTATDSKGLTGSTSITVTITAPPVNQPPVASFTVNCSGQSLPHQCAFDGSSSTDDHGVVSWIWNWGNGKPAETKAVPTARNTFAAAGTYQVTLTVTDGSGLTSTITKSVVVP